jgi:hypothetical protein
MAKKYPYGWNSFARRIEGVGEGVSRATGYFSPIISEGVFYGRYSLHVNYNDKEYLNFSMSEFDFRTIIEYVMKLASVEKTDSPVYFCTTFWKDGKDNRTGEKVEVGITDKGLIYFGVHKKDKPVIKFKMDCSPRLIVVNSNGDDIGQKLRSSMFSMGWARDQISMLDVMSGTALKIETSSPPSSSAYDEDDILF